MIIHIRAIDIEYSDAPRGPTPLENALTTRWHGVTVLNGERRVRVVSKVDGERQWVLSPRLRSYLATWEAGHPVKPGWFRLKRIKTGG